MQSRSLEAPVGHCLLSENPDRVIVAERTTVWALDLKTKAKERLADLGPLPGMRINDGGIDPLGRLWFGTTRLDDRRGSSALYVRDTDGSLQQVPGGLGICNGMAWIGNQFYFIDSMTRGVDAYRWTGEGIQARDRHHVLDTRPHMPDGLCLDRHGCLWIALCGGSSVLCWDPVRAATVQVIPLPVSQVTSCCFGGPEGRTLFIPTAADHPGMPPSREPALSGRLFAVEFGETMGADQDAQWRSLP